MKFIIKLIRIYFKTLSVISPKLSAKKAFILFQKPRRLPFKKEEIAFYKKATSSLLNTSIGQINYYSVGNPVGELVILVHGWDSNAGSMSGIGDKLAEKGYHVISLDFPAHGNSKLKYLNVVTAKESLKALIKKVANDKPFSLIAHSFGSLASAITLSELQIKVKQLIYLTTPDKASTMFEYFRDGIGLSDKAFAHLVEKGETLIKAPLATLDVLALTETIKYEDLLLIHDKYDRILPYKNSVTIDNALTNSSLFTINKIGHSRMLWNENVQNKISDNISIDSNDKKPKFASS
jgi:pimeloyl-ACP methyl ester carboxylesterase